MRARIDSDTKPSGVAWPLPTRRAIEGNPVSSFALRRTMRRTMVPRNLFAAAVLTALAGSACRDAISPPAADPVQPPSLDVAGDQEVRSTGLGTIGPGDAVPGGDRQEFDFDVASTLAGRVFYRDWSFVRDDGSVGTLTVDTDPNTGIRRFRDGSDVCADFTRGVEFDGTGRVDTGDLTGFTVITCDNDPADGRMDFFRIDVVDYHRENVLTSGDVVKTGGGRPRATGVRVTGIGQLGAGLPLPGSDVQTFEFHVSSDLTGAKFITDWGVIRSDGTVGNLRVDPLDLGTGITAFRDGSSACADFARGVEFDGIGRVNTAGETDPAHSDLRAFTVRMCDNGLAGSPADYLDLQLFHLHFAIRYEKGGFVTAGDILKSRM